MATIYQPIYLSPQNISVDMSVNQNFTCTIDGLKIDAYRIIIYKVSDNSTLYNSTKVTLGSVLYNGETLTIQVTGGTVANGLELKYTIEYWNGAESVISNEIFFISASTATLTISVPATVTAQAYEFVGTYTQAQSIPLKQWYYILYDSNTVELERSDISYSGNVKHTFDGFISGQTYKIKGFAETQDNTTIESTTYTFAVTYSGSTITTQSTATLSCNTTAVQIDWGSIVQIIGAITGTYSYTSNFIYTGNYGLHLDSGSYVTFSVNIPSIFTGHHVFKPDSISYVGDIYELNNSGTGNYFKVGYNGTSFYKNIDGNTQAYLPSYTLTTNYFLIILIFNKAYILEFDSGGNKVNQIDF